MTEVVFLHLLKGQAWLLWKQTMYEFAVQTRGQAAIMDSLLHVKLDRAFNICVKY